MKNLSDFSNLLQDQFSQVTVFAPSADFLSSLCSEDLQRISSSPQALRTVSLLHHPLSLTFLSPLSLTSLSPLSHPSLSLYLSPFLTSLFLSLSFSPLSLCLSLSHLSLSLSHLSLSLFVFLTPSLSLLKEK